MPEVHLHPDNAHLSMEERIRRRLKNSGGEEADFSCQLGQSPLRTIHNNHGHANTHRHGPNNPGEPGIDGRMRTFVGSAGDNS
jgi:hypothetical protein